MSKGHASFRLAYEGFVDDHKVIPCGHLASYVYVSIDLIGRPMRSFLNQNFIDSLSSGLKRWIRIRMKLPCIKDASLMQEKVLVYKGQRLT